MRKTLLLAFAITLNCIAYTQTPTSRHAEARTAQLNTSENLSSPSGQTCGNSKIEKATVISNYLLVVVGIMTAGVALCSIKYLKEQAKISKDALVAQFRPRVEVRSINLIPSSAEEFEQSTGGRWELHVNLINCGGTAASVETCEASFQWGGERIVCSGSWANIHLKSGERYRLTMTITEQNRSMFWMDLHMLEQVVLDEGRTQTDQLICTGRIRYFDENKAFRETGFLRLWDVQSRHFHACTDPELEYID